MSTVVADRPAAANAAAKNPALIWKKFRSLKSSPNSMLTRVLGSAAPRRSSGLPNTAPTPSSRRRQSLLSQGSRVFHRARSPT